MATFLTDMMKKGYTQDEGFAVLFESEREKKCREMLAIVTKTVDAHCLDKIRETLTYEKLATFRRMNGFDQDIYRLDDWRSLPPTPHEYNASRRYALQKLKDAISMPRRKVRNLMNDIEEDRMDLERGELESSSASTSLETPGQQCPSNEGIWGTGRTTADGILTAVVGSNQGGSISSPTECVDTRASTKSTATLADISSPTEHVGTLAGTAATPDKRRHKTSSEENKQFDPGGKGEKAPPWNAAVTLLSFSGESWEAPCLCFVFFCLCFVSVCFLNDCSFQVITSQRAERHEGRCGSSRWCTQPEGKYFLAYYPLEDGEDKQHPVWS